MPDSIPLPAADLDGDAFLADIVAAGPAGLRVKAGLLVAREDGDFDLILDEPAVLIDTTVGELNASAASQLDKLLAEIVDDGAFNALGTGIVPRLLDIKAALAEESS